MKIINLDEMCPESATIVHNQKEYLLAPLGTEELLRIIPVWEKYSGVGAPTDLATQLNLSIEFISQVLPDFPEEELRKLTAVQLRHLMTAVMNTIGLTEPDEKAGAEGPKADAA